MENKVMKVLLSIVFAISCLTFVQAQNNKQKVKKLEIDPIIIDYVEIVQIKSNKKLSKPKRINKTLIQKFVSSWNAEHPIIPCSKDYSYILSIYYKDLTKKEYFLNKSIVSDNKSYCIDIGNQLIGDQIYKAK